MLIGSWQVLREDEGQARVITHRASLSEHAADHCVCPDMRRALHGNDTHVRPRPLSSALRKDIARFLPGGDALVCSSSPNLGQPYVLFFNEFRAS